MKILMFRWKMIYRVLMIWTMPQLIVAAQAQNAQNNSTPTLNGTVVSVAADSRSFMVIDRTGNKITVPVGPNTTYLSGRNAATFSDVVKHGMNVRCMPAPDGSAAEVTGRGLTNQLNLAQLQAFMGASDDEWALLKPRIEKVQMLRRITKNGGNGGNNQDNGNGPTAPSSLQLNERELRNLYFHSTSNPDSLMAGLSALRNTRSKARAELAIASKELTDLLSARQETLLVIMGILD